MRSSCSSRTRLYFGFNDASGRLWNFNFSDTRANGTATLSRNAFVTRMNLCEWVFTDRLYDTEGRLLVRSLAELSTLVRVSGKQVRSFEGVYEAPFQIKFHAPNCTSSGPQ